MWLRVDRADGSMAFLENMGANPITSQTWQTYNVETVVDPGAASIAFGVIMFGPGRAWVDDVAIERLVEYGQDASEPARPLTARGLANVTAFTRLYGYIRFFHPSDQTAQADWETLAVEGIRKVEGAPSDADLVSRLLEIFRPFAPSLEVFVPAKRPAPSPAAKTARIARYKHTGVGLPPMSANVRYSAYSSFVERLDTPQDPASLTPFEAQISPGITALVPLVLPVDSENRTLPVAPAPAKPAEKLRTAHDRAARLAAVVIAWNVFQHFYPYFDVVRTDWPAELQRALRSAAADEGPEQFHKTLQRLVAALHDGHGNVGSPGQQPFLVAPLTLASVENQWIVTRAGGAKPAGVLPGDRVLSIDGKPVAGVEAALRPLTSAATEGWMRSKLASLLRTCDPMSKKMRLELEPFAQPRTLRNVELACEPPKFKDMEYYPEPRPDKIADLEAGILYIDLDRVGDKEWPDALARARQAKAIVFDMRGYPSGPGIQALRHLTIETIRSARWNIPSPAKPDRLATTFIESGWPVQPAEPYIDVPRVFLTDGRAISYAETVMGIVENYRLAGIVGEPTAGTNGNVNPFRLPGGYTVAWTGMKVLKHDGSQHHGIGILPTVPASRTRAGVAAGRDEILDSAVTYLKSKLN
jgi:C-terminal processing protease CtpA/Prc